MIDNVNMAIERGYLRAPEGMLVSVRELPNVPHEKLTIVTTGSQGEPTSALTRMANQDHQHVKIVEGDTVILSASAVPGNEALVHRTVDNLFKLGANVLYNRIADVHVRGHAAQEELKIVHTLVRPTLLRAGARRVSPHGAARAGSPSRSTRAPTRSS